MRAQVAGLVVVLALALLAGGWAQPLDVTYLPAPGVILQEGELTPITLRVENTSKVPVAVVQARGQGALDPPALFLGPQLGAITHDEEKDLYIHDTQAQQATEVPLGNVILLPGEKFQFTLQAVLGMARRAPAYEQGPGKDYPSKALVPLELVVEHLPLTPEGGAAVYLAQENPARSTDVVFARCDAEALEGLRKLPPAGRHYLLGGAPPAPETLSVPLALEAAGDRTDPAVQKVLDETGAAAFWSKRRIAWVVELDGVATLMKGEERWPVPGWSLAALLMVDGGRRPIRVRFDRESTEALVREAVDLEGDPWRYGATLAREDLEDLEDVVEEQGLAVTVQAGGMTSPPCLLISTPGDK